MDTKNVNTWTFTKRELAAMLLFVHRDPALPHSGIGFDRESGDVLCTDSNTGLCVGEWRPRTKGTAIAAVPRKPLEQLLRAAKPADTVTIRIDTTRATVTTGAASGEVELHGGAFPPLHAVWPTKVRIGRHVLGLSAAYLGRLEKITTAIGLDSMHSVQLYQARRELEPSLFVTGVEGAPLWSVLIMPQRIKPLVEVAAPAKRRPKPEAA